MRARLRLVREAGIRLTVALLPVLVAGVALAGDNRSLSSCDHALKTSTDPVERVAAVRRMAEIGSRSVPARLAFVAQKDADPAVRVAAAESLGRVDVRGADRNLLTALAEGGPRRVREAMARSAGALDVSPADLVEKIYDRRADQATRLLLIAALGAHPSPLAAPQLEYVVRTKHRSLRPAALRALAARPDGKPLLPDLVFEILESGDDDLDLTIDALEIAGSYGDERILGLRERLGATKSPVVLVAVANALLRVAARVGRSGPTAEPPPAQRARIDIVHVFHQSPGTKLSKMWGLVSQDLTDARLADEDVRVGIVSYIEPAKGGVTTTVNMLPLTRDEAKIEKYFKGRLAQVHPQRGMVMARSIEEAYDRSDWRWDADRTVVLHASVGPRDKRRAQTAAGAHFVADATRIRVLWYKFRRPSLPRPPTPSGIPRTPKPVPEQKFPDSLRDLATVGGARAMGDAPDDRRPGR